MKKLLFLLLIILSGYSSPAQFVGGRSYRQPQKNYDKPDKVAHASMGIGAGQQFGGLGFRFQLTSAPIINILQVSAFAGGGYLPFFESNYAFQDGKFAYAAGAKLHANIAYFGFSYGMLGYEGLSRQTSTGQYEYKDIRPIFGPAALVGFEGNLYWLGWSMVNYTAGAGIAFMTDREPAPILDIGVHFRL